MLLQKNSTVTICHTRTTDLAAVAREADILITTVGKAGMIGVEYTRPDQIILDVGINVNSEGCLCGDVDYEEVEPCVAAITPVPGGVGSVTTSILVEHVADAAIRQNPELFPCR